LTPITETSHTRLFRSSWIKSIYSTVLMVCPIFQSSAMHLHGTSDPLWQSKQEKNLSKHTVKHFLPPKPEGYICLLIHSSSVADIQ
jgi:hypothetical protein